MQGRIADWPSAVEAPADTIGGSGHMTLVDQDRATRPQTPDRHRLSRDVGLVRAMTLLVDLAVLVFAVLAAWKLRGAIGALIAVHLGTSVTEAGPVIIATWVVMLAIKGAYGARNFGTGANEFRAVGSASITTAGLVSIACFMLSVPLSRGFLLLAFVFGTTLLLVERFVIRITVHKLRRKGRLMHRVIAVGGPSGVGEVVDALRQSKYVGYEVVGAAVPDGVEVSHEQFGVPVLGEVQQTRRLCEEVGADTVLVTRGGFATAKELRRVAWDLEGSSIQLVVVPSVNEVAGSRIHMRPVAGLPLLHLEQPQAGEAGGLSKRLFDLVGAAVTLLLLSPLMVLIALAIYLEDRGPILFSQPRIGRDGRTFRCFKFRSMFIDAESQERDLREAMGQESALWKMERDPRVTRIGGFIRRYSLDELPQLLNVLRGEMSLVGPRPQQRWEVDTYTDWEHRRLRVRPGMTGLWQVSGRSQLSFDEAIRLDLYYVDNWSMTADLVIMAKTVGAVVNATGAY
jgi:exopolysaccharide biosynthesis polyprenyl glycosylphosphotransferase